MYTHTHVDVHPCTYVQVPACIQSAYTQVDVHRCAHMYTRTQTRVCIHTWTYASVYVCIYSHVSAWMSTCARVCLSIGVYTYIYILTDTHVHTRTETHIRVCVCLSVCLSVCRVRAHARIYGESTSILQKGLFCPTPIKASDTSTSKRETTPDERSGQEARTDPFLPKKGRTDRHPEAQGRTHIHGRAGLGWGCWGWGRAHGSTPPRGVSLDNDPSHSEGKGPGAGNRSHDSKFEPSEDSGS